MMTAQPLEQWPKWRDSLVYHLRMKDVRGDRIGDILLEVDTHLRESGESPEDAFGDAKSYADSRAGRVENPLNRGSILGTALGAFAGVGLMCASAFNLGTGADSTILLPSWVALGLGIVLLAGTLATLPVDLVRHPTTGKPLFDEPSNIRWRLGAVFALIALALYILGRFLA